MPEYRFVEPLDVLFPRGNKLFGEAGQHGEAQIPPWPSVAAGAIRSRMLVDRGADLMAFAHGAALSDAALHAALGTPAEPGTFRIQWFSLAQRDNGRIVPIWPLPADVVACEEEDEIRYVSPQSLYARLVCSAKLTRPAVLRQARAAKPQGGLWLNGAGLSAYLRGQPLSKYQYALKTGDIWKTDVRLGIALDHERRSAAEGRLYTTEGIALHPGTGFLVAVRGTDGLVPNGGLVRFGGDGRGARIENCNVCWPDPDWNRIADERRFRLVLATPGLFEHGWLPAGVDEDGATWQGPDGITACLVSAAVPRARVISGWDLVQRKPKPAMRAAPVGGVYWFEAPDCDGQALVMALRKLAEEGFGYLSEYPGRARLAEGFNNVMVANWVAGW